MTQPLEGRAGSAGLSGGGAHGRSSVRRTSLRSGASPRQSGPPDDRRRQGGRRTRHQSHRRTEGLTSPIWWSPSTCPDTRALARCHRRVRGVHTGSGATSAGAGRRSDKTAPKLLVELAKAAPQTGFGRHTGVSASPADADSYELVRRTRPPARCGRCSRVASPPTRSRVRRLVSAPSPINGRHGRSRPASSTRWPSATSGRTRWSTRNRPLARREKAWSRCSRHGHHRRGERQSCGENDTVTAKHMLYWRLLA